MISWNEANVTLSETRLKANAETEEFLASDEVDLNNFESPIRNFKYKRGMISHISGYLLKKKFVNDYLITELT